MDITLKEVQQECIDKLKSVGFRMSGTVGHYSLSESILAWLGVNIGQRDDTIRLHPNFGAHCIPVARCYSVINGQKYKVGSTATCSVPLRFIYPDAPELAIAERRDLTGVLNRLVTYVEEGGKDYMMKFLDPDFLEQQISKQVSMLGGFPEKYALTLLLHRKYTEFEKFSHEHAQTYEVGSDSRDEWEEFCRAAPTCIKGSDGLRINMQ